MRKFILLFMVGIGLSGCGGDDNNSKPNNNNQSKNDPVLKETLSLTNQPQRNFEQAEPKSLTEISESPIDNKADPVSVKF
ncbi:hypothetical protein [Acinetobacter venetianus]|uniref:hypothetical protein n=1 Tax=Acinetobacter venetianus TaxID=52133 RepID=UPI0010A5DBCD|nr:hypothetical protein [Acinetobacter venetianus]MCR4531342.1 hypothetical protein [Acinetobacter venetianus]MDA0696872.1 hypothetical protein [Pseudomonadota bacterium]MDA1255328.1 hypothetical protein [Pseudomonadota bacterium]